MEETAYHEAGHALAAFLMGARVLSVTIEPDRDDRPPRYGETTVAWDRQEFGPQALRERGVFVALAGPVAEMIYSGQPFHPGIMPEWAEDWRQAWNEAETLHPTPVARLACLEQTAARLHRRFRDEASWAAIAALADHLLAHDRAEEEDVTEILGVWLP